MDAYRAQLNINLGILTDTYRLYYLSASSFDDVNELIQNLFTTNGVKWMYDKLCDAKWYTFVSLLTTKTNETCILDHLPLIMNDELLTTIIELLTRDVFKEYLKTSYTFIKNLGKQRSLTCIYYYMDENLLLSSVDDTTIVMMLVIEHKQRLLEMMEIMALDWELVMNTPDASGMCANDYLLSVQ